MRKMKIHLLCIAVFGICAAFANRPPKALQQMDHYAYWYTSTDGSRMYYLVDLTAQGWVQGIDYDCIPPQSICTFIANPIRSHNDLSGTWFFTWDVPQSGIDDTGVFDMMQ